MVILGYVEHKILTGSAPLFRADRAAEARLQ